MDQRPEAIVVTGWGKAEAGCDPTPWLKVRKSRKFMGKQDDLAVTAAGQALASAGLSGKALGPTAGLYLSVGHIAFERADIDHILDGSLENGAVSMRRFSSDGYVAANPLLTFRCLSNMPAYHVSVNFDVQGPYMVSYPGAGQFYLALEAALESLRRGRVDVALVGGVADQRNFLVEHHFSRLTPSVPAERLRDAAGFVILETEAKAKVRGAAPRARLSSWSMDYAARDPYLDAAAFAESFEGANAPDAVLGPGSLPFVLSGATKGRLRHRVEARDGVRAESEWEVLA